MNGTTKNLIIGGTLAVLLVVGLTWLLHRPEPGLGAKDISNGTDSFETSLGGQDSLLTYTFFSTSTTQTSFSTSTNATSTEIEAYTNSNGRIVDGKFVVAGAKRVLMYFGRGDVNGTGNAGTSNFRVQISPDGTNWHDYNRLIITGTTTRSGITDGNTAILPSVDITNATSTVTAALDMVNHAIYAIRCIVLETTDGDHSCRASADWE